jgi:hypothetical protein
MTHLDTSNISYGQKKGQKSNCQFDFRPFKFGNLPDFLVWRWCATYCWKALNKSYICASNFISIRGLHTKLWAQKSWESELWEFRESHLGVPGQNDIWVWFHGQAHNILLGGRWWLPLSLGRAEFCEFMFARGLFVHKKRSNYAPTNLLFGLYRSMWVIDVCHFSLYQPLESWGKCLCEHPISCIPNPSYL